MEFLKITPDESKFVIAPLSAENNGKYLVIEDTEERANQVKSRMMANPLSPMTPLTAPDKFEKLGYAVSGTPVYRPLF